MLPIIFLVPVVQMVILVYAATFEMKHIDMYIIDKDMSSSSRSLITKFEGSPFFYITNSSYSLKEAERELIEDKVDLILNIPSGFEKILIRDNISKIQLSPIQL